MRITRLLTTPKVTMIWTHLTERGDVALTLPTALNMTPGDTWTLTLGALQARRGELVPRDFQRVFGSELIEAPFVGVVPSLAILAGVQLVVTRAPVEISYLFRSTRANFRAHLGLAEGDRLFTDWRADPDIFQLRTITDLNPNEKGEVDSTIPTEPRVDGTWREGLDR